MILALVVSLPFIPFLFLLGERFSTGLAQRFGFYPPAVLRALRGERPIWIHAASVGEVDAATRLSLALRRRRPGCKIVLSTFTATGNLRARQMAAADAVIFLPLDQSCVVRRALGKINPAVLIFLETEIWPNLLRQAYRQGIATLLLSGRVSVKSFRQYARLRSFFSRVLRCYSALGMQSQDDAERVRKLGAQDERVFVIGNLKRAPAAIRPQTGNRAVPMERSGDRQLLIVGSSHRGEEEILLDVFTALRNRFPKLKLVLAPRHPQRFLEVEKLLRTRGVNFARRSQQNGERFDEEVLLLDTVGELADFYALGDVAFIGGSLVNAGGHNILEPARWRKPVLFGPFMDNFRSLADEMKRSGGGVEVRSGEDLIREISDLLGDPCRLHAAGEKAFEVAAGDPAVLNESIALAERYLQPAANS